MQQMYAKIDKKLMITNRHCNEADDADDLALFANPSVQAKCQMHRLEQGEEALGST